MSGGAAIATPTPSVRSAKAATTTPQAILEHITPPSAVGLPTSILPAAQSHIQGVHPQKLPTLAARATYLGGEGAPTMSCPPASGAFGPRRDSLSSAYGASLSG